MYAPPNFLPKDSTASLELIRSYPLATLISLKDSMPFVSHLPLVIENEGGKLVAYGHLARANPHSALLANGTVYAIFHGPNAYITPQWYAENDVPTWNYAVVHIKGECQLLEQFAQIENCLKKLSLAMEGKTGWEFWLPEDLSNPKVVEKSIVGFRLEIAELTPKFKLSQNRSQEDAQRVISGLHKRGGEADRALASLMHKHSCSQNP